MAPPPCPLQAESREVPSLPNLTFHPCHLTFLARFSIITFAHISLPSFFLLAANLTHAIRAGRCLPTLLTISPPPQDSRRTPVSAATLSQLPIVFQIRDRPFISALIYRRLAVPRSAPLPSSPTLCPQPHRQHVASCLDLVDGRRQILARLHGAPARCRLGRMGQTLVFCVCSRCVSMSRISIALLADPSSCEKGHLSTRAHNNL